MIKDKKKFIIGITMICSFVVILYTMFLPLFNGKNSLEASDDLFNSISKGSSYYIPGLKTKVEKKQVGNLELKLKTLEGQANDMAIKMLEAAKMQVKPTQDSLTVSGDFSGLLLTVLNDADKMFNNQDTELSQQYSYGAKETIYLWSEVLKAIEDGLNEQSKFAQSAFVSEINKKAIELSYNYAGIEPQSASSKAVIIVLSLIFYICYTLWWGYAILILCEGLGLQMSAGKKKEV
ncbi:MAG: hypothetical protein L3V56_05685 [Candidatus Magnetoovum sp. WYHC-5]|nr:hypothetical protein [Candidatus Magnetoovum sp. WYHC-5]